MGLKTEAAPPMNLTEEALERLSSLVMKKMMTKDMFAAARLLVSKGYHVLPGRTGRQGPVEPWDRPPFSLAPDPEELRNPFDSAVSLAVTRELCNPELEIVIGPDGRRGYTCPDFPPPPNTIPDSLADRFTMGGQVPVRYLYHNDKKKQGPHNDIAKYKSTFEQLENRTFRYYDNEVESFYEALDRYSPADRMVVVWGLDGCNCEAMAIWRKAALVYVVDYNKPRCDHPQVISMNLDELRTCGPVADYAISFSSFEHDGLGRYGDPIDPDGDLRAMAQARDALKTGGIMLFGVPLGRDCLVWNSNRVYGAKRLPLLLKGWAPIDVFNPYGRPSPDFPFDALPASGPQPLMILEKIDSDYPDLSWLKERLKTEATLGDNRRSGSLRDGLLLLRLWQMLKQHAYPEDE